MRMVGGTEGTCIGTVGSAYVDCETTVGTVSADTELLALTTPLSAPQSPQKRPSRIAPHEPQCTSAIFAA